MKQMIVWRAFAVLIALAGCDDVGGIGKIHEVSSGRSATAYAEWDEVFANGVKAEVTGFLTGYVEAGPQILIDTSDPRVPDELRKPIWVPTPAYLVEASSKTLLMDTGLKAGVCSYGTRPAYWVPCRNRPGSDAMSQLKARGIKPSGLDYLSISHFHGDHVSALADILAEYDPVIVSTEEEIAAIKSPLRLLSGYERVMLQSGMTVETINPRLVEMPILGAVADLFGDGSVWLVPTPGHTNGHMSALINTYPTPLLLTFDASHLKEVFELNLTPGAITDRQAAGASIARLIAFKAAYPKIRVVYGHEPTQWGSEKSYKLGTAAPSN